MAVYTALDRDTLDGWLQRLDVGPLVEWRGIESGIENSNFFVVTRDRGTDRHFVLTLFERLGRDALPWYLGLMQHCAKHGIPCPAPIADRDGALCSTLAGKPAALVTRLTGASVVQVEATHCAAVGSLLARMHRVASTFADEHPNPRGLDWWVATAAGVRGHLDDAQRDLLDAEVAEQSATWPGRVAGLPRGPIHADLFRDNALFVGDGDDVELHGVIDFYFAGCDAWVLDIAICINDWCIDGASGALDPSLLQAFVTAYEAERPITVEEREALPQALRAAALRFWLSRLDDLHRPRPAQMLVPHDPGHFERMLRRRRADRAIPGLASPSGG